MSNNHKIEKVASQNDGARDIANIDVDYSTGVYDLLHVRAILAENTIDSDVTNLADTLAEMTKRGLVEWTLKNNTYTTRLQLKQLKDPVDCELFVNGDSSRPFIILRVSQEESQHQVSWSHYFGHGDGSGNLLECVAGKVLGLSRSETRWRYVELHPRYAVRGFETEDEGE